MTTETDTAATEPKPDLYSARVGWALAYAARLHATQLRKGKKEPYLSHILQVTALVVRYGGTEDQMIAGTLHDVAEDCGGLPASKRSASCSGRRSSGSSRTARTH